jgi:predicted 3-demethylubiquinone-9 3-methyltransferase (glyoxalase superfamily)
MSQQVRPFLMFTGQAQEAMDFYVSLFPGARILDLARYGPAERGAEGTVKRATFSIGGQTIMCTDSVVEHDFTFTPSLSLYVTCHSEEAIHRLTDALAEDGSLFMPLSNYGFSRQYAWVSDRFGVSWQLNLEDGPNTPESQEIRNDNPS